MTEQAAADLLLSIPDEPIPLPRPPTAPDNCPECGAPITRFPECGGMWSESNANGDITGGGWWRAECRGCGVWLRAYWDMYFKDGDAIIFPPRYEPGLVWKRDLELSPVP